LSGPRDRSEATRNATDQIRLSSPPSNGTPLSVNKRVVVINKLRAPTGEKQDYTKLKATFEEAIREIPPMGASRARSLRPLVRESLGQKKTRKELGVARMGYLNVAKHRLPGSSVMVTMIYSHKSQHRNLTARTEPYEEAVYLLQKVCPDF